MYDSLIESPRDAVGRLRRSMQLRRQADIEEMQALSELAAEHSWSTEDELDVTRERATRLGADGSPLVGEFLPLEVAAVKGISTTAATWLIRDVINLQSRHPHLWGWVCRGEVQPYRERSSLSNWPRSTNSLKSRLTISTPRWRRSWAPWAGLG